ncbi:MAG TPA: LacI family DNA-binding transcriptional regulator [Brevundimonas sp.]|jgi:LacI family transcriptional regulator
MKAATIRDVARHADVSVASVSRALNGTSAVNESTRQRILHAIDVLRYVPHSGARSLSTSRTDTVGVILPDLFGEFFSELIRGMDLAARAHGMHLIVSSSHDDADEASAAIRSMRGRVDGLIVLSPYMNAATLTASMAGQTPVLLMNGGAMDAARPSIVIDNRGGAITAVEHLLSLGRRRIAHISGPTGNLEAEARLLGYAEALAGTGVVSRVLDGDFTQGSGYRAVSQMLAGGERPDAIFAGNDMMAVGALLALQEAGVRCPEDVAVVGFDDVPIAELVRPALTTMRIDIAGTGKHAMERLVALVKARNAGPGHGDVANEIVRPTLVVRGSTTSIDTQFQSTPAEAKPTAPDQILLGEIQDV